MSPRSSLTNIEDFLAHKRLAMVGLSRNPKDFSAALFRELCSRGYDVVPVNPRAEDVQGRRCFACVREIVPPVEVVLLMTPPRASEEVVAECVEAGIRTVWMYRGAGTGAVSAKAVEMCRLNGIRVVAGECPFMFFPKAGGVHRFHGWWRKLIGEYPKHEGGVRPAA